MRKIKFRGKRNDGVWVFGSLAIDTNDNHTILSPLSAKPSSDFWNNKFQYNEVAPETVGQFTGLTDKNGKEIYEGDIVKLTSMMPFCAFGNEFVGQVSFFEFAYLVDNGTEAYSLFSETDEIEIIGNIHDNSELLKL